MSSKRDLKEEIASVAYEIYERTGVSGREVENWIEAERIVLEGQTAQESSKKTKKLVFPRKDGGPTKKKMSGLRSDILSETGSQIPRWHLK